MNQSRWARLRAAVSRLLSADRAVCLDGPCFRRLVNYSSDVFPFSSPHRGATAPPYLCYWPGVLTAPLSNVCLGHHSCCC